jgi:hypothetical protein
MVSIEKNIFYNEGLLEVVNIAEMKTLCNDAEKEKQKQGRMNGSKAPVSCNSDIHSILKYCEESCSDGLLSDNCAINLQYASDSTVKSFFELVHERNELNINCQHIYVAIQNTPGLTITEDVRQSLAYRRAHDAWEQIIQPTLKK